MNLQLKFVRQLQLQLQLDLQLEPHLHLQLQLHATATATAEYGGAGIDFDARCLDRMAARHFEKHFLLTLAAWTRWWQVISKKRLCGRLLTALLLACALEHSQVE